jgi:hypothetical protein
MTVRLDGVNRYTSGMDARLAGWTRPRSDVESAYEDVDRCRNMSPADRIAEAAALSRSALAFMDRFEPDERRRLLVTQEPLDPRYELVWRALIAHAHAS